MKRHLVVGDACRRMWDERQKLARYLPDFVEKALLKKYEVGKPWNVHLIGKISIFFLYSTFCC